ncbi:MAG: hypothetical protein M3Q69_19260 [Acidobacteriota bacterium]|nr:hypothetical protein [Acidobacteriota bacterium]
MNRFLVASLCSVALITPAAFAQADNPLVQQGSVGPNKAAPTAKAATDLRMPTEWAGERFIVLPSLKKNRHYGTPTAEYIDDASEGKTFTIEQFDTNTGVIVFKDPHTGKRALASFEDGAVPGIAPVRDIEYAREKWMGKTLWLKTAALQTYDAEKDELGVFAVAKLTPVTVTNIVAGFSNRAPVRFVVKTAAGDSGFVDVNLSNTNVPLESLGRNLFDHMFFEKDPKTLKWSAKVMEAVAASSIFVGMTPEQVIAGWGVPERINRTTRKDGVDEQWVYGENYVYFVNGVVDAIDH